MKAIIEHKITAIIITSIVVSISIYLCMYYLHWERRPHVLEMYFFSLDRGQSVFIRTPYNKTILIDGGQNTQVLRELTKVFPFYRRRIDTIILTSSLPKDSGGLAEVVQRFSIGKVIEPSAMGTSTALDAFEKAVFDKKLEIQKVKKGDMLIIDGINLSVLFPDPDYSFTKTNLPEMVLDISYGSTSAMLLGDISKSIQKTFISEAGKTDIVEYADSASDSLVSSDLFKQMNPEYGVISKQIRSTPSKPPKKIPKIPPFDIEKQEGTAVLNLIQKGTQHFVSNGESFELK